MLFDSVEMAALYDNSILYQYSIILAIQVSLPFIYPSIHSFHPSIPQFWELHAFCWSWADLLFQVVHPGHDFTCSSACHWHFSRASIVDVLELLDFCFLPSPNFHQHTCSPLSKYQIAPSSRIPISTWYTSIFQLFIFKLHIYHRRN